MQRISASLLLLLGIHFCGFTQIRDRLSPPMADTAKARILTTLMEQFVASGSSKNLDTALVYGQEITQLLKGHPDTKWRAGIHQQLANIYLARKNIRKTEEELLKALEVLRPGGKTDFYLAHITLADFYFETGSLNKSLFHCLESIKGIDIVKDDDLARQAHFTIAIIYRNSGRFQEAINHYEASARICKKQALPAAVSECKTRVVNAMLKMNLPKEALSYAQQLEKEYPPASDWTRQLYANMYGECYKHLGQHEMAEKYFLKIFEISGKDEYNPYATQNIGQFYLEWGKYDIARPYLKKVYDNSFNNLTVLSKAHLSYMLYKVDSAAGDYISAMRHLMMNKALDDSAIQEAKYRQINELQISFETARKDQDIKMKAQNILLLTRQTELQEKDLEQTRLKLFFEEKTKEQTLQLSRAATEKKDRDLLVKQQNIELLKKEGDLTQSNLAQARNSRNMFIGSAVMLLLLMGMVYSRYQTKQRINRQLEAQQKAIHEKNNRLQQLLTEKEWLLKEVHHRVKNNLHTVMSLLESQSAYLQNDALAAVRESQHRVYAMSLIHQKLYQSEEVTRIKMPVYLPELVNYLSESFDTRQKINFQLQVAPLELDVSQAIPVGLILNEAITNAIKYAFAGRTHNIIRIEMTRQADQQIKLSIADNGIGLPSGFDSIKPGSLGLKLMQGLTGDIGGSFQIDGKDGCQITILFPDISFSARATTSLSNQFVAS